MLSIFGFTEPSFRFKTILKILRANRTFVDRDLIKIGLFLNRKCWKSQCNQRFNLSIIGLAYTHSSVMQITCVLNKFTISAIVTICFSF